MAEGHQLQFFNPDNPPQAWSKAEGNARLEGIKAQLKATQMERVKLHNTQKQRGA